jgi:LPXTG-site transpeptidase (sortase) family protein
MTTLRIYNHLHFINTVLFTAVVAIGIYLIVAPVLPDLVYYIRYYTKKEQIYTYQRTTNLRSNNVEEVELFDGELPPPPGQNLLFIPKIGVRASIEEGNSVSVLEKGIWHRPKTGNPAAGGNTVFVAHRFLYTSGPNTFYHLDKLAPGDRFAVWWEGTRYEYTVESEGEVRPSATEIELPTSDNRVTLWTCTPLFTAKNRLVVVAKLTKKSN